MWVQLVSINVLPDDVLLDIFGFYVAETWRSEWQTLVHVCRRWRSIVFGSPRSLELLLVCSDKTPARTTLNVWPPLPLHIDCQAIGESADIVAVLERSDRVCFINLKTFGLEVSAAMQVPFPELTYLRLSSNGETVSALPDSFLGGSAPRLKYLWLEGIPFPGLPKLLLSAANLDHLVLYNIPHSGYFPPEAIATALSTLTCLEVLQLFFESPQSRPDPDHQRLPPLTHTVLPNFRTFQFKGNSEYVEVVVAHIDAPRLIQLHTTLFNDIVFNIPQLSQFISRTPAMRAFNKARVTFQGDIAIVQLSALSPNEKNLDYEYLTMVIPCSELDWQVSSMEQVCASCLPPLLNMEHLYIYERPHWQEHWQDNIENALWLELLHPFTSVKNLYLSKDIARRIVPALQELVGDRATEVLPTLEKICLEERQQPGPVQEGIQQVVAVRQASNRSIAVSYGNYIRYR
jgi:hypothetical protein